MIRSLQLQALAGGCLVFAMLVQHVPANAHFDPKPARGVSPPRSGCKGPRARKVRPKAQVKWRALEGHSRRSSRPTVYEELQEYVATLDPYVPMTWAEQKSLGDRIARGREAMLRQLRMDNGKRKFLPPETHDEEDLKAIETLSVRNLRLVVKIGLQYARRAGREDELLDVIGEGDLGLVQAARRFESQKNVPFGSYAGVAIKGYILNYLMNTHSQLKIGSTLPEREAYHNYWKARGKLIREGKATTPEALAHELGTDAGTVEGLLGRLLGDPSLDEPARQNGDSDRRRVLRVDLVELPGSSVEDMFAAADLDMRIERALSAFEETLKGQDRVVYDKLIAPTLFGGDTLRLREVAEIVDRTIEAVSKRRQKVEHWMRNFFDKRGLRPRTSRN